MGFPGYWAEPLLINGALSMEAFVDWAFSI